MSKERASLRLVKLVFEGGFDELEEFEAESRGYRSHVWAELSDGSHHPVTFYEPTRLSQTLADECASGRMFFAERGLIIVPAVTRAFMEAAAETLAREGFFSSPSVPG